MELEKSSFDHFENQLDIRSLVRTHTNLALLIKLLFTEQEKHLFDHQDARVFTHNPFGPKLSNTDDDDPLGKLSARDDLDSKTMAYSSDFLTGLCFDSKLVK